MQKIHPFLWFDTQAEDAANFYVSVFKNSKIQNITRYGDGSLMPKGTVMTVKFIVDGQEFVALNGGPHYKLSPAVSFVVNCDSQSELDEMWAKLTSDGGQEVQCGWLTDKFGLSWQIVPSNLGELVSQSDPEKSQRVMGALMQMKKLDIAKLEQAAQGA